MSDGAYNSFSNTHRPGKVGLHEIGLVKATALQIALGKRRLFGQDLGKVLALVIGIGKVLSANVETGKVEATSGNGPSGAGAIKNEARQCA